MNRQVASTSGLTTVRSSPCRSAISPQYGNARPTQRICTDPHPGVADGVHVEHVRQVVDVRTHEVVRRRRSARPSERHPSYVGQAGRDQLVRPLGDDTRRVGVRRAAVRRVVLEATVAGRVVRRSDHDPVGQPTRASAVEPEDRVRDGRGRACSRRGRRRGRSRRWRPAPRARSPRPARTGRGCRDRSPAGRRTPAPCGSRRSPGSSPGCASR